MSTNLEKFRDDLKKLVTLGREMDFDLTGRMLQKDGTLDKEIEDITVTTHGLRWIPRTVSILLAFSAAANAQFTEAPGSPITVGTKPLSVAVGDFNRDGKPDLAIANEGSGTVTVLLGDGRGGFTPAPGSPFKAGADPTSVAVGDFSGDGKPDLAIANGDSDTVTVLLGNGKGGFTVGEVIPTGSHQANCVAVGDFNGDKKADLAVANFTGSAVSVLLGNGKGGFMPAPTSPLQAKGWWFTSVAVGDFNEDNKPDLAITATIDFLTTSGSDSVLVLLGDGTGGFPAVPASAFTVGTTPQSVAVGDFNEDGKPDLAIANEGRDDVTVLLGSGKGEFTVAPGSPFKVGTGPFSVAVGDLNGDGKPDLAIANRKSNTVTLLLGNGKGGFTAVPGNPSTVGSEPFSVAVGDFNGDGKPDIAVADYGSNTVTVLLNSYSGSAISTSGKP